MPQNSLTTCIDSAGVYYRVPIACINDPQKYEQNLQYQQMKEKDAPVETTVNVSKAFPSYFDFQGLKIRLLPDKDVQFDISNLTNIGELKQKFIDTLGEKGSGLDAKLLRFFCMG